MIGHFKQQIVALVLVLGTAGCAGSDADFNSIFGTQQKPALIQGNGAVQIQAAVNPNADIHERRLIVPDELPAGVFVPPANFKGAPVMAALQMVLAGSDVSLSWTADTLAARPITIENLSGPLPLVVEKLCAAGRVFCNYRHGSLEVSDKETFIITVPPASRAVGGDKTMLAVINQLLGDNKSQLDTQSGTLIYTTTFDGEEKVSQYLAQVRGGHSAAATHTEKPLPDPVIIDKNGARPLVLSHTKPVTAPVVISQAPQAPPPAVSGNGASVDRHLMQHGFSNAYDQLLQSSGTSANGGGP